MLVTANRTFATAGRRVRRGEVVDLPSGVARVLIGRGTVSVSEGPSVVKPEAPQVIKPLGAASVCEDCGASFGSAHGLAIHRGRAH